MFKTGDEIEVEVRNHNLGMLVWRPETTIHRGRVVDPFPWSDPNTLCMTSGDGSGFIRQIGYHRIVDLRSADGSKVASVGEMAAPAQDREWVIPGSRGASYVVTNRAGRWACNCPAGSFNRNCKHVAQAKEMTA
jgi:hypothetical protein